MTVAYFKVHVLAQNQTGVDYCGLTTGYCPLLSHVFFCLELWCLGKMHFFGGVPQMSTGINWQQHCVAAPNPVLISVSCT